MTLLEEFKAFALRGNVIDLATGVVIGTAFGAIVSSFVNDILMPPLGLLLGGVNFSTLSVSIGSGLTIAYGHFIQAVVNFFFIALVIFLGIKLLNRATAALRRGRDTLLS